MKNLLAVLRWWAQKVGQQNIEARSNGHYGIPNRQFVTNASKARRLGAEELVKIRDAHVRMSLELQRAFGLHREEAIKFMPSDADRGDHTLLKEGWTKGGKARAIPVRTDVQRAVLERARRLAGKGSPIPSAKNYRQQLVRYEAETGRAGLSRMHGRPAPRLCPGPLRGTDWLGRLTMSHGLGHERPQIVAVYCGT